MVVTFTSTDVFSAYRLESEKFVPKWQCLRNRNLCDYVCHRLEAVRLFSSLSTAVHSPNKTGTTV